MTHTKRIALSSDHSAIELRQAIAAHIATLGWEPVDTFSARAIRQHNDANMLSLGARVLGQGLALDIVEAFLTAQFEAGRHTARVEMIGALEA